MGENRPPAGGTGGATDPPPPLVVPTTHESTRAQYYCGQTVNVPGLGDVVITEEHIAQAELIRITVGKLLDIEPMSKPADLG